MKRIYIKLMMPVLLFLIILIPGCYSANFLGGMNVALETVTRWVNSAPSASAGEVKINSVAVDSNGNIYAVGYITGTGNYNFGTGTIIGKSPATNVLIIKYNSSGVIQWVKTVGPTSANLASCFNSVAVDANGNIYAVGYITGDESECIYYFNSLDGQVQCQAGATYKRVVIVKYNSSGEALWAKSTVNLTPTCEFKSVVVNSIGEIFAAGYINSNSLFNFGGTGQVNGGSWVSSNVVLVKYNSSGIAQWAKSATTANNPPSEYYSVVTDTSGNIYTAGYIATTIGSFTFGSLPTFSGGNSGNNSIIVKYNSSGDPVWAKSTVLGSASTLNHSVAVDTSGNIYTAGTITGQDSANFGTAGTPATVTGISSNNNICLVKYNSSGEALWARSNSTGSTTNGTFRLYSVFANASGDIFCAGYFSSTSTLNIGGLSVTGMPVSGTDATGFLVKFNSNGTAQWIRSSTTGSSSLTADSEFNSVAVDSNGYIYAAGYLHNSSAVSNAVSYGNNISLTLPTGQYSPVVVKYKEMNIVNFE